MVFAIDNFVGFLGLVIPTFTADDFTPPLKVINMLFLVNHMPYINHSMWFKKDPIKIQALLGSDSEINIFISAYTAKRGLKDQPTNVGAQKINGSILKTFRIVLASF